MFIRLYYILAHYITLYFVILLSGFIYGLWHCRDAWYDPDTTESLFVRSPSSCTIQLGWCDAGRGCAAVSRFETTLSRDYYCMLENTMMMFKYVVEIRCNIFAVLYKRKVALIVIYFWCYIKEMLH